MNNFFIDLFRNDTFGPKMGIFNITHILALLFTFISCAGFCAIFYFKKEKTKKLALDILTICVIGLYFLDFFIHPFMNGGTDTMIVDKLPFHLCTSMCLLIGLARIFPKQLGFLKTPFTILGMVGGLMYIMVPTALVDEYLFCYRSLQTWIYHSCIFMLGVASLVLGDVKPKLNKFWLIPIIIAIQIGIALFANYAYAFGGDPYNWYFVVDDMFGIPGAWMPLIIFLVFNLMSAIFYGIYYLVLYIKGKASAKEAK